MSEPLLSLEDVTVEYRIRRHLGSFDYHTALKDISLQVNRDERVGIVGRNGAGKSTLLRILSGVSQPNSGRVTRAASRVALLSLNPGFDPNLNAFDNALFGAMLMGHSYRTARAMVDDVVEMAELGEFANRPLRTYSSGMVARLGFSVAVCLDAELLLVDEVFAVGDARFREKAERVILKKLSNMQAFVLVSHQPDQVARLCDRVLWLDQGRIRASGKPDEVLEAYQGA